MTVLLPSVGEAVKEIKDKVNWLLLVRNEHLKVFAKRYNKYTINYQSFQIRS